jgi:RimJ/RimL family protein N-acetyltransferase
MHTFPRESLRVMSSVPAGRPVAIGTKEIGSAGCRTGAKMVPMGSYWPLFDLELHTPSLVLRPHRDDDFPGLLDAIDAGIHDPAEMPFSQPWTDAPPAVLGRNAVQFWWGNRAGWRTDAWNLELVVVFADRPIGIQDLSAKNFVVMREVSTGSWLSRPYQGRGLGKEMRAAVLHLAFEGLGADIARSAAFRDNPSSAGVSRALGYRENGEYRHAPRGKPKLAVNFELTREEWVARRDTLPAVEVVGLEPALEMFGLPNRLAGPADA